VVHHPSTGERIDEVLAVVMRGPHSYTGEDVAELQGHGGQLVLARVLEAALAAGARMAQPGEFTRRAFEAGRIDLSRAEAVAALIGARGDRALRAAQALNAGVLDDKIRAARNRLVQALAEIEGAIDFPEDVAFDDSAQGERATAGLLRAIAGELAGLAQSYRPQLFHGAQVAIVGRVNAGKSSLLNALAGEERAIVDAAPGTTRDAVQVEVAIDGVPVLLVDTAGEREEPEPIELRGLELGRARAQRADVSLLVVDGTVGFGAIEAELWARAPGLKLIAWNKRDIAPAPAGLPDDARAIETSAMSGTGIERLRDMVGRLINGDDVEEGVTVVSARQAEALRAGVDSLTRAATLLETGEPSDLAAVEARRGLDAMGRVTGETVDAEVLDAIFARFCIGK
jgi:tRNA modification GTPase